MTPLEAYVKLNKCINVKHYIGSDLDRTILDAVTAQSGITGTAEVEEEVKEEVVEKAVKEVKKPSLAKRNPTANKAK